MALAFSPFVAFHLRRFVVVAILTLGFASLSAFVGNYIDRAFGTSPLFLIICLIAVFFLLQVVLFKVTKYMVKEHGDKSFTK